MFPKRIRHQDKALLRTYYDRVCVACNARGADPHHVRSKKSGGADADWNLMPLSRDCHTEVHKVGLNRFAEKHGVKRWLLANGWYFCEVRNKWVNDLNNAEQ